MMAELELLLDELVELELLDELVLLLDELDELLSAALTVSLTVNDWSSLVVSRTS